MSDRHPTLSEANEAWSEMQRNCRVRLLRADQLYYRERYRISGPRHHIVERLEAIAKELIELGIAP